MKRTSARPLVLAAGLPIGAAAAAQPVPPSISTPDSAWWHWIIDGSRGARSACDVAR
ncbi:MAG TPA: hypothetical protein PLG77_09240 [Burkholderiaceae bacterium]|jgi:hypothetical protein|nr:hypothetical protein [Burkholderiaceae bacterium]HMN75568.1 hypothetical protein [Burkholderiaceae bacterium]HRP28597.1 hypothetical protein [Burkholderiaceae bacterium]